MLGWPREYWMKYRGSGFLAFVWFGSSLALSPLPLLLSASCLSPSRSSCVPPVERERGRGWGRSQNSFDGEKAWSSINHWILSGLAHFISPTHMLNDLLLSRSRHSRSVSVRGAGLHDGWAGWAAGRMRTGNQRGGHDSRSHYPSPSGPIWTRSNLRFWIKLYIHDILFLSLLLWVAGCVLPHMS